MSHKITALYQMLQIFPRLEFRRLALVSYFLIPWFYNET